MSFNITDLRQLYKFAIDKKFIMETGYGLSTQWLYRAAVKNRSIMVSIDPCTPNKKRFPKIDFGVGWSIKYEDLINSDSSDFCDRHKRYRNRPYPWADEQVVKKGKIFMSGETDLIRKKIAQYKTAPDFFFCDTGEFCGLAEWNVISPLLPVGGFFAAHDIYYPRSIKCFKVKNRIENSKGWKIRKITKTKQGLLIAEKICDFS